MNKVIADSINELRIIEKSIPHSRKYPVILLSHSFSFEDLNSFEERGFDFYDSFLTEKDTSFIHEEAKKLSQDWFIDKKNSDITKLEHCSVGESISYPIMLIFKTVLGYMFSFRKILQKNDKVICTKNTERLALLVLKYISTEIGFEIKLVGHFPNNVLSYIRKKNPDHLGRYRNFSLEFSLNIKKLIAYYLTKLQVKKKIKFAKKIKVLHLQSGKNNNLRQFVKNKDNLVDWVIPMQNFRDIWNTKDSLAYFVLTTNISLRSYFLSKKMLSDIKENLSIKNYVIHENLVLSVFEEFLFPYIYGIISKSNQALNLLQKYSPSMTLLTAETNTTNLLVANAAKFLGIKTVLTTHGLTTLCFSSYIKKSRNLFEKVLTFTRLDYENYLSCGVDKRNIYFAIDPYFGSFSKINNFKSKGYKRAMILLPDISEHPADKMSFIYHYFESILDILNNLNIKIELIKSRNKPHELNIADSKYFEYKGVKIPVYGGYDKFSKYSEGIDIVIGPASTAILESLLLNIDYYIFVQNNLSKLSNSYTNSIYEFANISFTKEQLYQNIKNKKPLKNNRKIQDIIDLSAYKDMDDINLAYQNTLSQIYHSK